MPDTYITLKADGSGVVSQTGSFVTLTVGTEVKVVWLGGDIGQHEITVNGEEEAVFADIDGNYPDGEEKHFFIIVN